MLNQLHAVLKDAELKITPTRIAVLEIFSDDCKPINAEYIYKKLQKKGIDQVTIYRTLTTFETKGILKKTDLRKGSAHYELEGHHHHHIVCTSCGTTEEFYDSHVEELIQKAAKKSSKFKVVDEHALELFGLCKSCSKV